MSKQDEEKINQTLLVSYADEFLSNDAISISFLIGIIGGAHLLVCLIVMYESVCFFIYVSMMDFLIFLDIFEFIFPGILK